MRRRCLCFVPVLAALAAAACTSGPEVAERPSVGEPIVVGSAEFTPYNLSVAATPSGDTVAVAWNDYDADAAEEHPFVATSTDALETFGAPLPVDPRSPFVAYPQLAMDEEGDTLIATTNYEADEGDGRPALYATAEEEVVPVVDLTAATPRVAFGDTGTTIATGADGRQVLLAWLAPAPDADSPGPLVAAVSEDAGRTWGEPQVVNERPAAVRTRAFAAGDQLGIAYIEDVPIPDAPVPTPAQPNPVTSTPVASIVLLDDDGTFGDPIAANDTDQPAAMLGPGVGGGEDGEVLLAWGVPTEDGDTTIVAAADEDDGFAGPLTVATLDAPPLAIEATIDGDGTGWVALATDADLLLYRIVDDEVASVEVDAVPQPTAEMVDLAPLEEGGVVLANLEDGDVVVRTVDS